MFVEVTGTSLFSPEYVRMLPEVPINPNAVVKATFDRNSLRPRWGFSKFLFIVEIFYAGYTTDITLRYKNLSSLLDNQSMFSSRGQNPGVKKS